MLDWANSKIGEVESLVLAAAVVMAILFVLSVAWRTRALVPIVVAAFTAGLVLFAVNNTDWFKSKIEEETLGPVPVVVAEAPTSPTLLL
jgi:hypothetical protein